MIQIIVEKGLAEVFFKKVDPTLYQATIHFLDKQNLKPEPVFPNAWEDPELYKHFSLETVGEDVQSLLEKLKILPGIEAAYQKPDDSLPL